MRVAQQKTWEQLVQEIEETFRKWHVRDYHIESVFGEMRAAARRKATRYGQTPEQRVVTLSFRWRRKNGLPWTRPIKLIMQREQTALANLELLAKAIELIRMAEVRDVESLVMKLYRQMYPETPAAPQPKPIINGPHAVLQVIDGASLAVAEAAYRTLAKTAHPDAAGDHERMTALNLAIEAIRLKCAKAS
jgi:hypothetical protein